MGEKQQKREQVSEERRLEREKDYIAPEESNRKRKRKSDESSDDDNDREDKLDGGVDEDERDAMLARITAANTKRNADARRGNASHDFVASSKSVVDNANDDGSDDDDDDDDNDRVAMKQAR